ncbi:uncharacterized protein PADG_04951 [Paracoccidioides brasiliensis Pb18]|uniref:Uncharacterized protein n=2 Tax=Paracoccidioides brasiliensis TaxID=121759 RepID=C1GBF0_PARBD|nr:uncharacterized protein PADG_04951 [Paracoccidioides brasiliensis Pb18]EEH48872.2 hypothetical protein PADG_04951 [Paracoccidioides brasiliensis Pb18]ODH27821.1 hypothetical protein ACO22_04099 [Paracoccidioides brasiliensis]
MKHNWYKVVKVSNEFVVKFGPTIEGLNMLFVQNLRKIRVPRVYAVYNDPKTSMKSYCHGIHRRLHPGCPMGIFVSMPEIRDFDDP